MPTLFRMSAPPRSSSIRARRQAMTIAARLAAPRTGGMRSPTPAEWEEAWRLVGDVPEVAGEPTRGAALHPAEIVERFTRSIPVDLYGLAKALGLKTVVDPTLPPEVSGKIKREGRAYRITLNGRDAPRRQRFTLAHEIGHFVLHRDQLGAGIVDNAMYRSRLSSELETQANRFAAELLMPANLVFQLYRQENIRSLHALADRFDVSVDAMRTRLVALRLGP